MILVTGATGRVGRQVIKELHKASCEVRALSRNPEKVEFPAGVKTAAGDLTKLETVRAALDGVEKVFWVLPMNPDFNFPHIARQHGVKHIVLLSALAVDFGSDNAIARTHQNAEQAVRESGADWTFLRPGGFMTNAFQWTTSIRSEGVVRVPFGDNSSPVIDSRDIAAVAVQALRSGGHEGKIYTLTGPDSLTPREQVHIIGDILGRELGFETFPDDVARDFMIRHMSAEIADAIIDLNKWGYTTILPTVEEVTGRAPFSFRQWASDHIAAFR